MRIRYELMILALLVSPVAWAQQCDKIVSDDNAGVLVNSVGAIEQGAQDLINQGADVHVLTVANTNNLDLNVAGTRVICKQWQSPNGGMKSTLIVLAVSPNSHKMGIYYGEAWKHALDDHFTRIKQDYMAPYFRSGDFAGGLVATEKQLAARLQEAKSEAVRPTVATTVVQEQPTDLSGLWKVMGWIVGLAALAGIIGIFVGLQRRRKKNREEVQLEQQKALNSRNKLVTALGRMSDKLRILDATKAEARTLQAHFDNISEIYSGIAGRESFNPDTEGLPVGAYTIMVNTYDDLYAKLMNLPTTVEPDVKPPETKTAPAQPPKKPPKHKTVTKHDEETVRASTTVVQQSVGMPIPIPIPIPIEEPVIVEEHHRRKDDDDDSSSNSSDGSSSWSSGSSDSGGGSSSWDSGSSSSDSGGGSSDFGGGSDSSSSGGGSSDF